MANGETKEEAEAGVQMGYQRGRMGRGYARAKEARIESSGMKRFYGHPKEDVTPYGAKEQDYKAAVAEGRIQPNGRGNGRVPRARGDYTGN